MHIAKNIASPKQIDSVSRLTNAGNLCNAHCMSTQAGLSDALEFDMADRLRRALRVSEVGGQEMADYLGVSRTSVSNWINGRVVPGRQTLRLWALRTGVPLSWLETGEAPRPGDPDEGLGVVRRQGFEPRTQ